MVKHIRWQGVIALIGIVFLSAVLALLAFNSTTIERPDSGGTYIEGIAGRPSTINPIFSQYNDVDRDIAALVFSGLTRADETGTIKPDLATHWTGSADGLVYTFTLRSDVRWHDSVAFTADDVLFTINSIQDPAYRGPPNLSSFWRTVAITAVNDVTVRFQLTQAYAPFLNFTTIGILPAHLLRDIPPGELLQNPFNRRPVGTGPFQVADVTSDSLNLDVNKNYYGARPYLSRIQFKFYADYEAVFAAFGRGEVEGIARVLSSDLPKARAMGNLKLYNTRLSGYSEILLNLSKLPFQDKAVRQALLYAIDRQHMIDDVLQGQGGVAKSPIEPESWAYDSALNTYPYDVEKAKGLLDGAGWKDTNGDGIREKEQMRMAFTLVSVDDPVRLAIANLIAQEWQAVGVQAVVQPVPSSLLVQNILRPRQFDAVLYEWRSVSSDPDQYENWHDTQIPNTTSLGQNYSGLADRDISESLELARRTNDPVKRVDQYRLFQELFTDRVPALLLFYPVYTYGVETRVQGVQIAPLLSASDRFRNVSEWYVKTKRVASSMSPERVAQAPVGEFEVVATATRQPTRPAAVATAIPAVQPTVVVAPSAVPPTAAPPTAVPATAVPPTAVPPTAVPPTAVPPTAVPPTAVPTAVPPTATAAAPAATISIGTSTVGQCPDSNSIIKSPGIDGTVSGLAEIRGTAARPNLSYWKLEYRPDSVPTFTQLFRSEAPVVDGVLSLWSSKTVPNGTYWLQLTSVDNTGNFGTPCQIRVRVQN